MPHELPLCYLFTSKKKKSISSKVQKSNSIWDQKSKLGPFRFSSTQSLSDLNGLGIVLILHESEQSPAQQDEQEWERAWCCLSSTRGCEPAASLSIHGVQAVTPSCIPRMLWVPGSVISSCFGIAVSHS